MIVRSLSGFLKVGFGCGHVNVTIMLVSEKYGQRQVMYLYTIREVMLQLVK